MEPARERLGQPVRLARDSGVWRPHRTGMNFLWGLRTPLSALPSLLAPNPGSCKSVLCCVALSVSFPLCLAASPRPPRVARDAEAQCQGGCLSGHSPRPTQAAARAWVRTGTTVTRQVLGLLSQSEKKGVPVAQPAEWGHGHSLPWEQCGGWRGDSGLRARECGPRLAPPRALWNCQVVLLQSGQIRDSWARSPCLPACPGRLSVRAQERWKVKVSKAPAGREETGAGITGGVVKKAWSPGHYEGPSPGQDWGRRTTW